MNAPSIKPATPLPWHIAPVDTGRFPSYPIAAKYEGRLFGIANVPIMSRGGSDKDAAYIVHACNTLPALEAELARLRQRNHAVLAILAPYGDVHFWED